MTRHHHPTEETLAAYVSGSLDAGRALVVAAHLESCSRCSRWSRSLQGIGGLMLEGAAPASMRPDALERAMAAIVMADLEPATQQPARIELAPGVALPRALSRRRLGDWQWIGPGIHRRMVEHQAGLDRDARVFLLRAKPGTRMPQHTHTGTELTLVLSGAFAHEGGSFAAGDFEEADSETEHQPVVQAGADCICLVAMQGNLKLSGMIGRLIQPFVRI